MTEPARLYEFGVKTSIVTARRDAQVSNILPHFGRALVSPDANAMPRIFREFAKTVTDVFDDSDEIR
jgi:hypothetical protein